MQLNNATYQYDANGNMTVDGRRGLELSWNHLNLPATISNDEDEDATVNYTYMADGTKVLAQAPGTSEGYAYLGTMVYKLNNGSWTLETTPFTGGRFVRNATGNFVEQRHITDHLGSTRAIVEGDDYTEVEQNDYYPFGKRIADNTLPTTTTNRWRLSGKEIQTLGGINLIDFGARLYDDAIVRWPTQDALAEKYSGFSPYCYCGNNPISFFDDNGKEIWIATKVSGSRIKEKVRYINGTLRNVDGTLYTGNNQFAEKVSKALSRIESINNSEVKNVMNEVINNDQKNIIVENNSSLNQTVSQDPSSAHKGNATGTQVTLDINESQHFDNVESTPETTIGHELQHVYDYNVGNFKGEINGERRTGKSPSEIRAVQFENIIRKDLKLPTRKTYGGIRIPQK